MSRYANSVEHLGRAEKTIPLGSQTFSKSRTQYPVGISPLYVSRAKGAEIWDVDGNKYIDLISALASVTLGYGDKAVEKAVKTQLKKGVSLSLPGKLEAEVSELIVEMVPSAEMVRFGKNGSDATAAAIRLARAFTGRDHILVCGYHGWQDWFIGSTTRNKGVPDSVSSLTHKFEYNNIESLRMVLDSLENQVAGVILEPMNTTYPISGFLEEVQILTRKAGALLIFDETITGFRYSAGGAQELFGVTPDLSTFGKGMANGFPLSAVVGRRDVMTEMEEIFFSGTFGGELLSLAASKVVLERNLAENVSGDLNAIGLRLNTAVKRIIQESNMESILTLSGHPTWTFLTWHKNEINSADEIKTYFMQEAFKRGLLAVASHNVTLAFSEKIIKKTTDIYGQVLEEISKNIHEGNVLNKLEVKPLAPLFKIRG